jgi:hypothetical protein
VEPVFTFDGLERREERHDYKMRFWRNGLLSTSVQLPLIPARPADQFPLVAIDIYLRHFIRGAALLYESAGISAPYLLSMMLRIQRPLVGVYPGLLGGEDHTAPLPAGDPHFPRMQIADLSSADRIIRPFCDQAHQMFGRGGSPSFNAAGAWIRRE